MSIFPITILGRKIGEGSAEARAGELMREYPAARRKATSVINAGLRAKAAMDSHGDSLPDDLWQEATEVKRQGNRVLVLRSEIDSQVDAGLRYLVLRGEMAQGEADRIRSEDFDGLGDFGIVSGVIVVVAIAAVGLVVGNVLTKIAEMRGLVEAERVRSESWERAFDRWLGETGGSGVAPAFPSGTVGVVSSGGGFLGGMTGGAAMALGAGLLLFFGRRRR